MIPLLEQGVAPWPAGAIHDTVSAILRDPAYRRSFWGSILGRILNEIGRFVGWLIETLREIPGGRNAVIFAVAVIILLIVARVFLAGEWNEARIQRKGLAARARQIDPWSQAQALAAAGDYMAAAHALYQGVLRRLAQSERIRLHQSKTTGDYVRDLRRRGSPQAFAFQAFGRRFDRVVFGAQVCTPEDFEAMLADAMAIPDRQAAA